MKNINAENRLKLSAIFLAVMAVFSNAVHADEDELAALKTPESTIEMGVISAPNTTSKFGEYSGIKDKKTHVNGGLNIKGGTAYGEAAENGGTERWYFKGDDLGLTSRSFGAGYSDQGQWNIDVGYDELEHSTTSGYQTPLVGTMGGNKWSLPSSGSFLASSSTVGTGALKGLSAVTSGYNPMDVSNKRENSNVSGTFIVDSRISLNFEYNHLNQTGAKLQGFGTQTLPTITTSTGNTYTSTNVVALIPVPTNSTTDNVSLGSTWKGDGVRLTATYNGSFYRNRNASVSIDPFYGTTVGSPAIAAQQLSLAPDNDYNQLVLAGGYDLRDKTKITSNLSFSRNTQNVPYVLTDTYVGTPPQLSMNGVVNSKHADLKLIDQSIDKTTITGQVKYDDRINNSPANNYIATSLDGPASASHTYDYSNTPLSTRNFKASLLADYKIDKSQSAGLGYEYIDTNRWCNNYNPSYVVTGLSGSTPATATPTLSSAVAASVNATCVMVSQNIENRLDTYYKLKFADEFDIKLAYSYGHKSANIDPNSYAAFLSQTSTATPALTVGGQTGLNGGNWAGFVPWFEAARVQHTLKATTNIQLNSQLSVLLSGKYTFDNYDANDFGFKNAHSYSLNLDTNYNYSEKGSAFFYTTYQHRNRLDNSYTYSATGSLTSSGGTATGAAANLATYWNTNQSDKDVTFGLGSKYMGLMAGKVDLLFDASYSFAATNYATNINYVNPNGGPGYVKSVVCSNNGTSGLSGASNTNPVVTSDGCSLPDIASKIFTLKMVGAYNIDKQSKISLTYMYQRLNTTDFFYSAYAIGANPYTSSTTSTISASTVLPNGLNPGNYNVNLLGLSYLYKF